MKKFLDEQVRSFAKSASCVKHSEIHVSTINRADIVKLNKQIEPKIKQNQEERLASFEAMKDIIVKD